MTTVGQRPNGGETSPEEQSPQNYVRRHHTVMPGSGAEMKEASSAVGRLTDIEYSHDLDPIPGQLNCPKKETTN